MQFCIISQKELQQRKQFLQKKEILSYCGSKLQQNKQHDPSLLHYSATPRLERKFPKKVLLKAHKRHIHFSIWWLFKTDASQL